MRRSVTPRCSGPETSSPATFSRIRPGSAPALPGFWTHSSRSEEHTSELQSRLHLVCRLLLEKKKKRIYSALTRVFLALAAGVVSSRRSNDRRELCLPSGPRCHTSRCHRYRRCQGVTTRRAYA